MILITGARGVVGTPLCDRLDSQRRNYVTLSRQPGPQTNQLVADLQEPLPSKAIERIGTADTLVHCAPIWLLPQHLPNLGSTQIKRLIVFSSTSVLSKRDSRDPNEQLLVKQLAEAETQIVDFCGDRELNLTLFRPSMIYGYGLDQNVMQIARFVKRFGFTLLMGEASGKRQPVHSDDLVSACLDALKNPNTYNKTYNLAGGEVVSYRELAARISKGLGLKPKSLTLPLWLFRIGLTTAAKLGRFAYTPEMANRMNQDLVYNIEDAERDFGFKPESFLQHPERDLRFCK